MEDEKKEATTGKVEDQTDFQKEWKKFQAGDFARLAVNVEALLKENETMKQSLKAMEKNIIEALGVQAPNRQQQ